MRSQLAHILGAWTLAQALLNVHGYHAAPPALTQPASAPPTLSADDDSESGEDTNDLATAPLDDALLVDPGFVAHSNFSKEAKAAAIEVLVRVLEAGPSSLEPVREAIGALKALALGMKSIFWCTCTWLCYRPLSKYRTEAGICDSG